MSTKWNRIIIVVILIAGCINKLHLQRFLFFFHRLLIKTLARVEFNLIIYTMKRWFRGLAYILNFIGLNIIHKKSQSFAHRSWDSSQLELDSTKKIIRTSDPIRYVKNSCLKIPKINKDNWIFLPTWASYLYQDWEFWYLFIFLSANC